MNYLPHGLIAGLALASNVEGAEPSNPRTAPLAVPEPAAPAIQLSNIVVTATQTEETPFSLPFSVSEIRPLDLERQMPRTLPEALRETPSVMLQKTGHGQGSPYLRGFTGFRTLLLVDGIRLNNSTFRDGPNQYWNTVDSYALDRMELVRGPGSVLYGSDAIGGTVNAFSLGRDEYPGKFDWDGRTYYRYASAEDSHVARAEVSGSVDDKFGFLAGGTLKEFGDLRGGEDVGRQLKTGYPERDWDAKLEYRLDPQSRLVFGHQTVDLDDAWRSHSTIYGIKWSGATVGTDLERILDQNRDLNYLQYHAQQLPGWVEEIHASISQQLQEERERRLLSDWRRERQGFDVNTLGASIQLQSPSPVGRWVYGSEYYRDWVGSDYSRFAADGTLQTVRFQGPVADNATYDLLGFYAQDQIPLFNERLEFIAGGRYSYAGADAGRVQDPATSQLISFSDSWDTLVGSGRLLYYLDPKKHWNVYGGVSQGFRAPNLSDLTRFDIARSGEQEVPAFNLRPEHFISYETGVKASYQRFAGEMAYFYTVTDDLITRVPTGALSATGQTIVNKENSGEGYVHGVELTGSVRPHEDWTLWSNFTWMEGRMDAPLVAGGAIETEPMSRLMPVTVNYGLRWEHPSRKFWAEAVSTIAGRQDRLSASDMRDTQRIPVGGTPGYDVYHLRAGWRPCRNFTLTAALENLADTDYRIHGSGLNEPGRNFVVSGNLRF